jgi:cytochrome c biogenesis protein ResB
VKAEKPGDPDMSVLSVSYDPGLRVVYAGCVLVMLGMAVTFYIKPKRQRLGWRWEI